MAEEPGGTDQGLEIGDGCLADAVEGEQASPAEVGEGEFDVRPRGVLGEDGADDDLEGGVGGPPVLGPPIGRKCLKKRTDFGLIGHDC